MRWTWGTVSRMSQISGVATLYGRLATSTHPPSTPRSGAASRVGLHRVGLDDRAVPAAGHHAPSEGHDPAVDFYRGDVGTGVGDHEGQRTEAGPDFHDVIPGSDPASSAMSLTVFGSATKFWPRSRRGARSLNSELRGSAGSRMGH